MAENSDDTKKPDTWLYVSEDSGRRGALVKRQIGGHLRAVVYIESAGPGHCIDTGRKIAELLNKEGW